MAGEEGWRGAVLPEAILGGFEVSEDTVVPAVLLATWGGYAFVVLPAALEEVVGLGEEVEVFGGEAVQVALEAEGSSSVFFARVPSDRFLDTMEGEPEPVVEFGPGGAAPDLGSVLDAVPRDMQEALEAARPAPATPARRQLRRGVGRGLPLAGSAGSAAAPPAKAGRGAGRGARPTVATLTDQLASLATSVQTLASRVEAQGEQLTSLVEAGMAPREPDLMLPAAGHAREALGTLGALPLRAHELHGFTRGIVPDPRDPRQASGSSPPAKARAPVPAPPGLRRTVAPQPPAVPPALAGPAAGGGAEASILTALQAQTAALVNLMGSRKPRGGSDPEGDSDEEAGARLPGARGPAALEALRKAFEERPEKLAAAVSERLRHHHSLVPGAAEDPAPSARAYMATEVPFGSYRTLAYAGWGFACVWDHLASGRSSKALALLSLLLVAVEQAALDEGRWQVAWLLTTLPEPPASMARRPVENALRPFAKLADPHWIAAAVAYIRDVDRLQTVRRSFGGKGKGGGDADDGGDRAKPKEKGPDRDKGKSAGAGKGQPTGRAAAAPEA